MTSTNNGPDLLLYYYPYSFASQKVVMALTQKHMKFRTSMIDIHKGKQYTKSFLALNPRGEVPVLVDDVRHIPDSNKIIDYIEDNFRDGWPRLSPEGLELKHRCEQLNTQLNSLNVEALIFGAVNFDDVVSNPKPPYNNQKCRSDIKDLIVHRCSILRGEAKRNPQHTDALMLKMNEIDRDAKFWLNRDTYESLLIHFERVLDECEAELTSHEDSSWWLCSPSITIADINLALTLHHIWQLGLERRMWERSRLNVMRYYQRMLRVNSFQKAISMSEEKGFLDSLYNPYLLGFLGTSALIGGGLYYWHKQGNAIPTFGILGYLGLEETSAEVKIPKPQTGATVRTAPKS